MCALGLGELARDVCELNEGIQKGMSFIVTSVVSTPSQKIIVISPKNQDSFPNLREPTPSYERVVELGEFRMVLGLT